MRKKLVYGHNYYMLLWYIPSYTEINGQRYTNTCVSDCLLMEFFYSWVNLVYGIGNKGQERKNLHGKMELVYARVCSFIACRK